jgi:O-antigen/teichoic acid export membrane protein
VEADRSRTHEDAEKERVNQQRRTSSLAGNAALLTVGSLFAQGTAIVTLSLLARLVPKVQLATYQQLALLYGIISPLLLGGIPTGLLFFLPKAPTDAERRDWIGQAYRVLGTFGLASMLLVIVLRGPAAELMSNPRLAPALLLYSPYLLTVFIASATPYALIAARRPVAAAVVNAVGGATTLVAVVAAALIRPDAQALAVGLSCGGSVWAIVSVGVVARTLGVRGGERRTGDASWRALLRFGGPLALAGVAAQIGYQIDRVVVASNFRPAQFAVYALGAAEVPLSLLVQQSTTSVLVPALATMWREGDVPGMIRLWREATRKTTLLIAPLFAFLMISAPDVIRLLFGPSYDGSVPVFRIYLLLMPLRIVTWGIMMVALGRTRVGWPVAVIMVVGNLGIALSLVGPLGLQGPAFAAPITTFLSAVYYLLWTRSALGVRIRDIIPIRDGAASFAICGTIAAATLPLRLVSMPSVLRLAIAFAFFAPCTVYALRMMGLVRDDDWGRARATLLKAWRRRPVEVAGPD